MSDGARPGDSEPAGFGSPSAGTALPFHQPFTAHTVTTLRHALAAQIAHAGLTGAAADDFVLAAHELVTNAVRHGGGSGVLELRVLADTLVCDVIDHGGDADGCPSSCHTPTYPAIADYGWPNRSPTVSP